MPRHNDDIRPGVWLVTLASLLFTVGIVYVALWGWPFGGFTVDESPTAGNGGTESARSRRMRTARRSLRNPVGASMLVPPAPTTFHVPFAAATETASVEGDPQLERSRASYHHRRTDAGGPPFAIWERVGRVAVVSGTSPVSVGETCSVRVLPVETAVFNCMVRVMCGDTLLYPDPDQGAGYVACSIGESGAPSYANDDATTNSDTDPMVEVNLALARIVVGDRAEDGREYHATISLDDGRLM